MARLDGKGMVPAVEILVGTARVRELIGDPKRTREINEAIATGKEPYGMVSFDQSLTDLVRSKVITYEEALTHATNPDDFALFFRGVSKGGSTVETPSADAGPSDAELEVDDGSIVDQGGAGFQIDRFKR